MCGELRYQILPRVLRDVSVCNTETTLLGHRIAFPICVAPTANHGMVHPDGEIATARGLNIRLNYYCVIRDYISILEFIELTLPKRLCQLFPPYNPDLIVNFILDTFTLNRRAYSQQYRLKPT